MNNTTHYEERELEDDYPVHYSYLYIVDNKVWQCNIFKENMTASYIKNKLNVKSFKSCDMVGRGLFNNIEDWHVS